MIAIKNIAITLSKKKELIKNTIPKNIQQINVITQNHIMNTFKNSNVFFIIFNQYELNNIILKLFF